jgi:hypothetical protein
MSSFDPDRLLIEPIYAMDFQYMVGDLQDFLDTSERNIEQQYHREYEEIHRRAETGDLPDGYLEHLQIGAEHRFKVSLPLRVRYGALVGLTTTVEWAVQFLQQHLCNPLGKVPKNQNPTVYVLSELNARLRLGQGAEVRDYEALVQVRNCVTHAAGIVSCYKYAEDLTRAIGRLVGFSVDSWHFVGRHVCIQRGALNRYIEKTGQLMIAIHKACDEQGLLVRDAPSGSTYRPDANCPIV